MARITEIDNLLFPVELHPVFTEYCDNNYCSPRRIMIPNRQVVMNTRSGRPLGVVSSSYRIVSNEKAIDMGKHCCEQIFGPGEGKNIEIFNVDAPSTGSFCHIDLVHKNYSMNLYDNGDSPETYIPYIRVTNSYNRSRALKFEVGLCRKLCLNGMIFESETIEFKFNHTKNSIGTQIDFSYSKEKLSRLISRFKDYTLSLSTFEVSPDHALEIMRLVFGVKENKTNTSNNAENRNKNYEHLIHEFEFVVDIYNEELGTNAYALFNAITHIASKPPKNPLFRKEINSLQRTAGKWLHSFQNEINSKDFNIDAYIHSLKSTNKVNKT